MTPSGRRQVLAFHIAGDVPDVQSLHLRVIDNGVATITTSSIGFMEHGSLRQLYRRPTSPW